MTNAERERVQGFGRLEEGLRQAGGWYLWVNRVRRKGETMGMGFNALVLTTIGCTSGRECNAVASMVGRDPR